jgi:hypothetical protein
MSLMLLYHLLAIHVLWYAPIYGWLQVWRKTFMRCFPGHWIPFAVNQGALLICSWMGRQKAAHCRQF